MVAGNFKNLFFAMRPEQWTKNLVIFAGVIFSEHILMFRELRLSFFSFLIFCPLCSSIYIFNDILDIERDRLHPKKSSRPVASGAISKKTAFLFFLFLSFFSLSLSYILDFSFFLLSLSYIVINVFYSLILKKLPILDVLTIGINFVIRALAGVVIIKVSISPWLITCTFLLALFMALGKRRSELVYSNGINIHQREVLSSYGVTFLDQMISVVTTSVFITYSLYTFSSGRTVLLMTTIPFVLYGLFRYLYILYQKNSGENPTFIFLHDRALQINMFLWLLLVFFIIYWKYLNILTL